MNLIFVTWEHPPDFGGGIGTYVHAASRALAARGHDVRVVTVSRQPYPQREFVDGVQIIRLPVSPGTGPEPAATLKTWQHRSDSVAELLEKLCRAPVDLIEFADYRGEGFTWLTAGRGADRPRSVIRLHTNLSVLARYNSAQPRVRVLEEYENQAIAAADHLLSPSQALAREMQSLLPQLPAIETSPHPVDPVFLDAPPAATAAGDEILYVGRLEQRKGVEALIEAAARVLDECPTARLALAGGDTAWSPAEPSTQRRLQQRVAARHRARVTFLGPVPRPALRERVAAARVCVFPSLFENFPNTCLEAMALGRPVIGTDNSGMAEMIENGVSGVIVPAGDTDELGRALVELFQAPEERRIAMGAAARRRVSQHYASDVIARDLEHLYARLVAASAPPLAARPTVSATASPPKVAIIVPCFNHGAFVRDALDSIRGQTHRHVETVIVDDGSTDAGTRRTLDELRAQGWSVIRQENQGLAAARNTGVRATSAPYFVPLDADDRISPDFVERLLPALQANPALGYAYSTVEFFGAAQGGWECPPYDPRKLLVENLSVATALVRRSAFDEAGGYQRDMIYGFEDWDFWLALLSLGYHGTRVDGPRFYYRKHAGGSMLSETQKRRGEMVHQMIAHHRTLFAQTLELALATKDRMFFQAHQDAWRLREHIADASARGHMPPAPPTTVDDELYQELLAQAELDHIQNSNLWRALQRLKRNPAYRAYARLRFGRDWERAPEAADPRTRLRDLKASRGFRAIQWLKRTSLYRWYARRKYGDEFEAATRPGG